MVDAKGTPVSPVSPKRFGRTVDAKSTPATAEEVTHSLVFVELTHAAGVGRTVDDKSTPAV